VTAAGGDLKFFLDQNGKPLAGAANTSFVKKCVTDAGKT
jgi:hypothetical protein